MSVVARNLARIVTTRSNQLLCQVTSKNVLNCVPNLMISSYLNLKFLAGIVFLKFRTFHDVSAFSG